MKDNRVIFKVLTENQSTRILYPIEMSFRSKGEKKTSLSRQKQGPYFQQTCPERKFFRTKKCDIGQTFDLQTERKGAAKGQNEGKLYFPYF